MAADSGDEILQGYGSALFLVQTVRVPLLMGVFCPEILQSVLTSVYFQTNVW